MYPIGPGKKELSFSFAMQKCQFVIFVLCLKIHNVVPYIIERTILHLKKLLSYFLSLSLLRGLVNPMSLPLKLNLLVQSKTSCKF